MPSDPRDRILNKTGDLATPPRDRLIPIRDLASLLACTEPEILKLADALGIPLEPLAWRGVLLTSMCLGDALQLHLTMRMPTCEVETSAPDPELLVALEQERLLRSAAEQGLHQLQERLVRREREFLVLEDRLNDLELVVAERRRLERDLEALRDQFAEADRLRRDLANRLQHAEENRRFMEQAQAEQESRSDHERLKIEWQQVQLRGKRDRTSRRILSLRRSLAVATLVERNLENYCDRLEQRLLHYQTRSRWNP